LVMQPILRLVGLRDNGAAASDECATLDGVNALLAGRRRRAVARSMLFLFFVRRTARGDHRHRRRCR
jgi:hypothetical protein